MFDKNYSIFEYELSVFCNYVSFFSDTPIHHTKQKPQIIYLNIYLSHFSKSGQKIFCMYEHEYVDQHFIEDYAEYYARCFEKYKKQCSRVHFFACNNLSSDDFEKFLSTKNVSIINNENYLGFIVIRPIPRTFLAKICLKPQFDSTKNNKFLLNRKYSVSLFGKNLEINSIAYQEQDMVVSACATSSLWSFFHAHPDEPLSRLPPPSLITKKSYPDSNGYSREFPNSGLSTEMICRSLRVNGLSPKYFEFFKNDLDNDSKTKSVIMFKEYIYAYCSSGLPLILGLQVYDKNEKLKGEHAVTILGYSLDDHNCNSDDIQILSHRLKKIYVHDDRYGMFLRLDFQENNKFKILVDTSDSNSGETYIPVTLIIATYHKIRISYNRIRETCKTLSNILLLYLEKNKPTNAERQVNSIKNFLWDLQIKEVSNLKNWIWENDNIKSDQKEEYLTLSLPKYIWSAKVSFDGDDIFEFLFDATGISQGDLFLGMLILREEGNSFKNLLSHYCMIKYDYRIQQDDLTRNPNNDVWGIVKFFKVKNEAITTV